MNGGSPSAFANVRIVARRLERPATRSPASAGVSRPSDRYSARAISARHLPMNDPDSNTTERPAWLAELEAEPDPIPDALMVRILEEGPAAVPPLLRVLEHALEGDTEDPLAIAAAQLLGTLEAVDAIPMLLRVMREAPPKEALLEAAREALGSIGAAALEPLLAAYDAETDRQRRIQLAHALALLNVSDERIFSRLVALYEADALAAAPALARYPDRRVQRLLRLSLEAAGAKKNRTERDDWAILIFASSLERAGGKLGRSHQRILEVAQARLRAADRRAGRFEDDDEYDDEDIDEDEDLGDDERSNEAPGGKHRPPIAECLMDLTEAVYPRTRRDPPLKTAQTLLRAAQIAWNLEVEALDEESYRAGLPDVVEGGAAIDEMIGIMRETKARLHPDDRRIVTELHVKRGPRGIRVRAEWAERPTRGGSSG